jgi:hypothetical protein
MPAASTRGGRLTGSHDEDDHGDDRQHPGVPVPMEKAAPGVADEVQRRNDPMRSRGGSSVSALTPTTSRAGRAGT